MKDYYQILGVSRDASQEEIRKAYRQLAHKHHPDKGGDEETFKEVNEAYQVLSDSEKRRQYDNFGTTSGFGGGQQQGAGFGGFSDFADFWQQYGGRAGGVDFEDLGDIFEEFFGAGFGGTSRSGHAGQKEKGNDLQIDVEIPLEATLEEIHRTVRLNKWSVCERCSGSGGEPGTEFDECFSCRGSGEVQQIRRTFLGTISQVGICPECKGEGNQPKQACNVCDGEGRVQKETDIEITIPAGVDSGQILRVPEHGEAGRRGKTTGDLYVRVHVKPHPNFTREGDDIYVKAKASISTAVLGGKIEVPTLEGENISVTVPKGTQPGTVLTKRNRGIPHFKGRGRGDMYITVNVEIPKKLKKEQKKLFEQLKKQGL